MVQKLTGCAAMSSTALPFASGLTKYTLSRFPPRFPLFFFAMVDYCTQVKNIQREEFGSCASSGGEVRSQQVELERIALRLLFFFLQVVAAFSLLKKNLRIDQLTGHRWKQ